MKYPEVTSLYKYRAFNRHSIQALVNEIAWFSKPNYFNDPFDCAISLDRRKLQESIKAAVIDGYKRKGVNTDEISEKEFEIKKSDKEAYEQLRNNIFQLTQEHGIYSLSRINNNILMWGHYADSHNGFCIEYSRDTL